MVTNLNLRYNYNKTVSLSPLIWFRIIFGLVTLFSSIRFWYNGWIESNYIEPDFHFPFFDWQWITPLEGNGMYLLFTTLIIASVLITIGFLYQIAAITFFLVFTYIELIDKTFYLNHYYFVSLIAFLLIWLPCNGLFSLDVKLGIAKRRTHCSRWMIDIIKFQIGCVYFFASVAKMNYYWIIEAQPLNNWLKHQTDLPVIGPLLKFDVTAYLFSIGGLLYDLLIPFLLLIKKTRKIAFILVIIFHSLVGLLFPIGVFPIVMIAFTTIFFDPEFFDRIFRINNKHYSHKTNYFWKYPIALYVAIQLILPFRYIWMGENVFWDEKGFRFSWRVMLIERGGDISFYVSPEDSEKRKLINNSEYLTPRQEQMMSTQPDMILQFARMIESDYENLTIIENEDTIIMGNPQVFVVSRASLFNTGSRPFIKENIDLTNIDNNTPVEEYIYSFE